MTILQINNVSMSFPGSNKLVLHNINYQINKGDFVILLGSNGSGKSTLLKLLQKQFHPQSGGIHFSNQMNTKIAVLNQNCSESLFTSLTIYENYLLMTKKRALRIQHSKEKKYLMEYLLDFNQNLSQKLDTMISQLSGGEKQALALAFCLLNPPSLLLLDEHTSALDPKTSEQIMQLTQNMIAVHGITCMLTTHDMDIALRYGNRILMLSEGKILKIINHQDKVMLSKEQLVKFYY